MLTLSNFIPDLAIPGTTTTCYLALSAIQAVLDDNTILVSGSRYGVSAGDTARLKKLLSIS
jgi:hypothetical protein